MVSEEATSMYPIPLRISSKGPRRTLPGDESKKSTLFIRSGLRSEWNHSFANHNCQCTNLLERRWCRVEGRGRETHGSWKSSEEQDSVSGALVASIQNLKTENKRSELRIFVKKSIFFVDTETCFRDCSYR